MQDPKQYDRQLSFHVRACLFSFNKKNHINCINYFVKRGRFVFLFELTFGDACRSNCERFVRVGGRQMRAMLHLPKHHQ